MQNENRTPHVFTEGERERRFLETLAATGSVDAACQASATEAHGPRAGKTTWYDKRRKDVQFAQAWDEALSAALGRIEAEIHRRAMEPAKSPIIDRQGNVVGHREDRMSSDRLLLRLASRLDPDAWAERRKQDTTVSGEITHTSQNLQLAPSDVLLLPEPRQRLLIELLEEVRDAKLGLDPEQRIPSNEDKADD